MRTPIIRSVPGNRFVAAALLTFALVGAACGARASGGPAERARPVSPRNKDSAAERAASLRAGDRSLRLEEDEQRFGIEQARERKRRDDEARPEDPTRNGRRHGEPGKRVDVVPPQPGF